MITRFSITNFKKFSDFSLEDLGRINIIIGSNNTGKTTTLEAVMGFSCGINLASAIHFLVWRRFPQTQNSNNAYLAAELLVNAFNTITDCDQLSFSFNGEVDGKEYSFCHSLKPGQLISSLLPGAKHVVIDGTEIKNRQVPLPAAMVPGSSIMVDVPSQYLGLWEVRDEEEKKVSCELASPIQLNNVPSDKPLVLAMFHDFSTYKKEQDVSKVYAHLQDKGQLRKFIGELNASFPDIKISSIDNIPYPDGSSAPIKIKFKNGKRHPIYALGDGFRRWYELLGGMLTFPNSIHCIEEADATLHQQAQEGFSTNLLYYSEMFNNQIFITTHNKEYLTIFLNTIKENKENALKNKIRVITLRECAGTVKGRILNGKEALDALNRGMELRI